MPRTSFTCLTSSRLRGQAISSILFFGMIAGASARDMASYDVVGIRIGDTSDQVKEEMKKFDPSIQLGIGRWPAQQGVEPSIAYLFGMVNRAGRNFGRFDGDWRGFIAGMKYDEYVQATFGQVTKTALFVVRKSGSKEGNGVQISALEMALIAKYGEPHVHRGFGWTWAFDALGEPAKNPGHCVIGNIHSVIFAKRTLDQVSGCGLVIEAGYKVSSADSRVASSYEVEMIDYQAVSNDIAQIELTEKKWKESEFNKLDGSSPRL